MAPALPIRAFKSTSRREEGNHAAPREPRASSALIGALAARACDNARLYREARLELEARDEAIGTVAHELRGPLNAILLQVQLLEHEGPEVSGAVLLEALGTIGRAAGRAGRLVQDLLDARGAEGGPLSVRPARLEPEVLVLEAIEAHRATAEAASVVIMGQFDAVLPTIWADRDRLLQALENLVSNAVKFTPPGGSIAVTATPCEGGVLFRVTDTGEGIDTESLPRIFERFWQARRGDRRGVGLGLAICKAIVEAHGGRVWVESELGVGSTFSMFLPPAP